MKHSLFVVCAFIIFVTVGCSNPNLSDGFPSAQDDSGEQNNPGEQYDPGGSAYAETYWGEWIRMDADETWYISGGAIKINGTVRAKSVSLEKQSERVVKVAEGGRVYYLYASRIANASFTGKIVGLRETSVPLSVAGDAPLPIQRSWLNDAIEYEEARIKNLDNGSTQTVQTDGEGEFKAEDIIPGDTYEITPEGGTPVTVTPQGDGDDVGTITVTEGVNFKTRITENGNTPYLYANGTRYDFTMEITNIGTADCLAATYQLSFDDGLVTSASTEKKMWGTIEPGASKTINLSLECDPIEAEYAYKKITITVTDDINKKTWVESVTVKFYKTPTYFYLETNPLAAAPVYGVVINPYDNKASRFQAAGEGLSYVTMPWSSSGYLVVFSGATVETEAVYALGVNRLPSYSDSVFEKFNEPGRYEPNGTEQTAAEVTEDRIMAYLHKNDIDYYHYMVPCPEKEPEFEGKYLSFNEYLDWIDANAAEGGMYTVAVSGDEVLAPRTLSYGGKTVSITLLGGAAERTVSLSSNGALFTVGSGVTLKLGNNITLRGQSYNTSTLVQVNSGGALEMVSGSKISGNTNTSGGGYSGYSGYGVYGGGVYVNGGVFTMSGGEIRGNSTSSSSSYLGFGGGVCVSGSGGFTMSGGEISGNSASYGGGVYILSGAFAMSGGVISGNSASYGGGGVYVSSNGSFTKQSGGIIYGSNANGSLRNTVSSYYYNGHAVYVDSYTTKMRNSTAGEGVTLDSSKDGSAGGWE